MQFFNLVSCGIYSIILLLDNFIPCDSKTAPWKLEFFKLGLYKFEIDPCKHSKTLNRLLKINYFNAKTCRTMLGPK